MHRGGYQVWSVSDRLPTESRLDRYPDASGMRNYADGSVPSLLRPAFAPEKMDLGDRVANARMGQYGFST